MDKVTDMFWEARGLYVTSDRAGTGVATCTSTDHARLIAQAPAMAEALRELIAETDSHGLDDTHGIDIARGALDRAGVDYSL